MGGRRPLPARHRAGRPALRDGHSAPERDGAAPHRSCVRPHRGGHPGALETDAAVPRALGARHRPRRHRHADGGRAAAGQGGSGPAGHGTRGVHRARLGVAPGVRRHDPGTAAPAGLLARLVASAVHPGSGSFAGGTARLRAPVPGWPDLQGALRRQLVSGLRHRGLGSGSRRAQDARDPVQDPLRRAGGGGGSGRGDDPSRDDAGRHGPGDPPGRSAQRPFAGQARRASDRGPRAAGGGRRNSRGPGIRHGNRQGHSRPRRQRLRRGTAARLARRGGHRPGRQDDGGGGGVCGARPLRGAQADRGAARAGGPPGGGRAVRAQPRRVPALGRRRRAVLVGAVVRESPAAGRAGDAGRSRRHRPLRSRRVGEDVLRLDGEHPRLVHLAPTLVGSPDSRLHVRERPPHRGRRGSHGVRDVRLKAAGAGPRRPGHVVLLAAVALLGLRVAGEDAGPRRLLPDRRPGDRATTSCSSGSRG